MKAIVQERYGSSDVLELREVEKPVAGDHDVLVRVRAASLHPDVWHVVRYAMSKVREAFRHMVEDELPPLRCH